MNLTIPSSITPLGEEACRTLALKTREKDQENFIEQLYEQKNSIKQRDYKVWARKKIESLYSKTNNNMSVKVCFEELTPPITGYGFHEYYTCKLVRCNDNDTVTVKILQPVIHNWNGKVVKTFSETQTLSIENVELPEVSETFREAVTSDERKIILEQITQAQDLLKRLRSSKFTPSWYQHQRHQETAAKEKIKANPGLKMVYMFWNQKISSTISGRDVDGNYIQTPLSKHSMAIGVPDFGWSKHRNGWFVTYISLVCPDFQKIPLDTFSKWISEARDTLLGRRFDPTLNIDTDYYYGYTVEELCKNLQTRLQQLADYLKPRMESVLGYTPEIHIHLDDLQPLLNSI